MKPKDIIESIEADIEKDEAIEPDVRDWNRASSLGWAKECPTHLVRKRLMPETEVISKEQRYAMHEGKLQETLMRQEFKAFAPPLGFEIVPAQAMVSPSYQIKGEMDDELRGEDRHAVDYKSASPYVFKTIAFNPSVSGLMSSPFPWIRNYPAQILTYSMLFSIPLGLLVFKNKVTGKMCLISTDVREWSVYMTKVLEAVTFVNVHVDRGTIPEYKEIESCRKCGFFKECWPDSPLTKEPIIITDAELVMTLARINELEWSVKEHKKLLEEVKPSLQELGERAIVGDFLIINKAYQTTVYPSMPAEVKAKYAEKKDVMRTDIKRLTEGL